MDKFTIITGIAGLLGLLLQFKDAFPEHRETRKAIVLLLLGVFVGSMVATLLNSQFSVTVPLSPFGLLIAGFGGVLAVLSIAAILSSDLNKRSQLLGASGVGLIAFLFVLLFGAMFTSVETDSPTTRALRKMTLDEFLEMSAIHAGRGNYDRA